MPDISSLYPQPPQQQQNLLQQNPLQLLGAIGQINQLKQFQAEFGAKQAIGNAYRNSLNPDGTLDVNRLATGVTSDPRAAYGLPEATSAILSQRGAQISNDTATLNQAITQNRFVADAIGSLDPRTATSESIHNTITGLARNTSIPSDRLIALQNMILNDPAGIAHGIQTARSVALGSSAGAARVAGPPGPGGAPQSVSATESVYGMNFPMQSATVAGAKPVPTVSYRQPGMAVGLPPGQGEAAAASGAAAGGLVAQHRSDAASYRAQVFPLEQAIPALERLGKTGVGPGTEQTNLVKSFLQSAGLPGFNADKIKDFDEVNKYLTDYVNQNGNTATNDKLAAAFAGNPSIHISQAASVDVAKSALALRRMKQAQIVEFEKTGLPDSEYPKWANQFQLSQEPRAYGFDLMSPESRQKVINQLSKGPNGPANLDRFKRSLETAESALGLVGR